MKTKEILYRLSLIVFAFLLAHFVSENGKQIISIIGFSIIFIISLKMHKHFFPFVTMAIVCYIMACGQELWSQSYMYLDVTKHLWSAGNILLAIGFINLFYQSITNTEK